MQAELTEQKDGAKLRGGGGHTALWQVFFRDFVVCAQTKQSLIYFSPGLPNKSKGGPPECRLHLSPSNPLALVWGRTRVSAKPFVSP